MTNPSRPRAKVSQTRGSREAYERYLEGMDASMRQKVALTAAHLACAGKLADMGMGSGAGSEALAALYPMLEVVGVDLDPTMVAMAKERYQRPNLDFVQGDIAAAPFPSASLDGIFDSSVLHHVTSFGGYDYDRAAVALDHQTRALAPHGVLVVRDFLAPEDGAVILELPSDDGDDSADPRTASTARLFERFAGELRSLAERPGFALVEEPALREGTRRFRTTYRLATEFVLRKDYRADWESEVKEEYTYFTQREFERLFARLGLRVLASTPLRNPWIVRNRFEGKFRIEHAGGAARDWPATNYLIAGEKVPDGEGVVFRELEPAPGLAFLQMDHYRDTRDGSVRDLVRRPHASIDVVPYFELEGDVFVVARMSYPRPLLASKAKSRALDESTPPHYVTEPLNVVQLDKPVGQTVEEMLLSHGRLEGSRIKSFCPAGTYYPSPGGSQEEVRSLLVEVEPFFVEHGISNTTGLSTAGRLRALEAEQVLRSAQVGGLPDARLELNVHELFLRLGRAPGPWIGEAIALKATTRLTTSTPLAALSRRPNRRVFARVLAPEGRRFLDLCASRFEEEDARGARVGEAHLEYVVPRELSTNTMVCALLARVGDEPCIGVDDDDLPAAQCFLGNSDLLVAPAWRLPKSVSTMAGARSWVRARLGEEYGLSLGDAWELGGPYYPSAGMSPEVAFPIAIEVEEQSALARGLAWVPLREIADNLDAIRDGHLRIASLRAAHALGVLARPSSG